MFTAVPQAFPGLWEIPLVMWNDHKDGRCSMAVSKECILPTNENCCSVTRPCGVSQIIVPVLAGQSPL